MVRLKGEKAATFNKVRECFNSLMVRLKVRLKTLPETIQIMFQFLDGAIKSFDKTKAAFELTVFQFLDGAIKRTDFCSRQAE